MSYELSHWLLCSLLLPSLPLSLSPYTIFFSFFLGLCSMLNCTWKSGKHSYCVNISEYNTAIAWPVFLFFFKYRKQCECIQFDRWQCGGIFSTREMIVLAIQGSIICTIALLLPFDVELFSLSFFPLLSLPSSIESFPFSFFLSCSFNITHSLTPLFFCCFQPWSHCLLTNNHNVRATIWCKLPFTVIIIFQCVSFLLFTRMEGITSGPVSSRWLLISIIGQSISNTLYMPIVCVCVCTHGLLCNHNRLFACFFVPIAHQSNSLQNSLSYIHNQLHLIPFTAVYSQNWWVLSCLNVTNKIQNNESDTDFQIGFHLTDKWTSNV